MVFRISSGVLGVATVYDYDSDDGRASELYITSFGQEGVAETWLKMYKESDSY